MAHYWAIIGDVVGSRKVADRSALQHRLEAAVDAANRRFAAALTSTATVTLGDEFQALFHAADTLPLVLERLSHGLGPDRVRFGVGYGALTTDRKARAVGMDGPCFHRARSAIDTARRMKKPVVVQAGDAPAERVTDVWSLAMVTIGERTARQAELVDLYREEGSQSRVAARVGITQATVSSELARGHFSEVDAVLAHLAQMLTEIAAGVGE